MRPALMDDMNYGVFADYLARRTGMHPAVCLALYSSISDYVTENDDVSTIAKRIKERSRMLSNETIKGIMKQSGMLGRPLDPATKRNAQRIMEKLPQRLQYLNVFIEYKIPQEFVSLAEDSAPNEGHLCDSLAEIL